MEKLPGVESATVKLNEGRAVLQLKPDNRVTIAQVRERVRQNGFTPRAAVVAAIAEAMVEPVLAAPPGSRAPMRSSTCARRPGASSSDCERRWPPVCCSASTVPFETDTTRTPVLQVTDAKPVTPYRRSSRGGDDAEHVESRRRQGARARLPARCSRRPAR